MCISNGLNSHNDRTQESLKKRTDNNMPDTPFISKITCVKLAFWQMWQLKTYDCTLIINYLKKTDYMNNLFRIWCLKSQTEVI